MYKKVFNKRCLQFFRDREVKYNSFEKKINKGLNKILITGRIQTCNLHTPE